MRKTLCFVLKNAPLLVPSLLENAARRVHPGGRRIVHLDSALPYLDYIVSWRPVPEGIADRPGSYKVYSFNAVESGAYIKVKALRLSGNNVTLVTNVDDNFKASSTTNISGETLFEIVTSYDTFYVYKGDQVVPAKNTSGDWCDLVVDDKGLTYSKSEDGVRQIDTELSYVFGEYPGCELFGWISDTEIVLDDVLYVASSTSR